MTQTHDQIAFAGFEPGLASEQIDAKAREFLKQLTLDEKIEMMDGDLPFWAGLAEMMGGGYANHPWSAGVIYEVFVGAHSQDQQALKARFLVHDN